MFDVRVNIYKFSDHDNNKFILLWGKSVCTYEYMDDLEKCNETWLTWKTKFLQSPKYGTYYNWRLVKKNL